MKNELDEIVNKINDLLLYIKNIQTNNLEDKEEIELLLQSDTWPKAIEEELMVDSTNDEDKLERASNIVSLMFPEQKIKDKDFLDFGCGEGHVVHQMKEFTDRAYGFDINNNYYKKEEAQFFDSIEEVKKKKFDVILLFDVIDHLTNPVQTLLELKDVLYEDGEMYIRCHPWCCRHGGHLYQNFNKAFAHLFISDEKFKELNHEPMGKKVFFPLKTYRDYFSQAGLKIVYEEVYIQEPEEFFKKNKCLNDKLKAIFNSHDFPKIQLEQNILDFVVKNE